jgi:hypothetical protein
MKIILCIYLIGILSGLYLAKKRKDPSLFWFAFIPLLGTYYATKVAINAFIKG